MLCSDCDEAREGVAAYEGGVGGRERGSKRDRGKEREIEREREGKKSAGEPKRGKGKQMKSDTLIQRASSA